MTTVLENDWVLRDEKSLLLAFWKDGEREMVRAIFTEGKEFRPVWKNELRVRTQVAKKVERRVKEVRLDEDDYGDFGRGSSDDGELDFTEQESNDPVQVLGGVEALHVRLRLLALLVRSISTKGQIETTTLWSATLDAFHKLPFETFAYVLTPIHLKFFDIDTVLLLLQNLSRYYISTSAIRLPETFNQSALLCYLPYGARGGSDAGEARMGVCVEALLRMFDEKYPLKWSKELERCIEDGILKRDPGKLKKKQINEKEWLEGSAKRLRDISRVIRERENAHGPRSVRVGDPIIIDLT